MEGIMNRPVRMSLLALLLGPLVAQAQSPPTFEMGLSTGVIVSTGKNNIYLLGLLRPGFFITPQVEVEAELGAFGSIYFDGPITVYGAGNFQVNFPASPSVWPFLLAGYGLTDRIHGTKHQAMIGVLNLGAGVKLAIGNVVGFRLEYRFQQWSGGEAHDVVQGPIEMPYSITHVSAVDYQYHALVFGTSVFF